MSQIFKSSSGSGPIPPSVPESFHTDVNSPSIAIAYVENIFGGTSTINNTNGIQTDGSSGSNTITIQLTNRATGSATTTGATSANLITLPLGATPGVYTFDITIAGFAKTGIGSPAGCGFTIVGSVRTTGAAATLVPTQVVDHFEEMVLIGVTAIITVSGNNAIVQVNGVSDGAAGFVIDWQGTLNYTFVS